MTLIAQPERNLLTAYCRDHHIRRLSLFGSQAKGTAGADSDIDLLVEFAPGMEPGLIGLASMEAELSPLFGGRKVDLRTPRELSRHFRDAVMRDALVHAYFDVDVDLVWKTATIELPALKSRIQALIS